MAKFTLSLPGPSLKVSKELASSSFDYASRHQIIAEIIKQYFDKSPKKILDVGGLGSPLSSILGVKTTILDEEATDSQKNQERRGDGAKMNLEDNSFDVVVTSDTLEHIPEKDRKNFVRELVRVSNDLVILCAPFNHGAVAQEEALSQEFFKKLTGEEHRWLKEHEAYGLPEPKKIMKYFKDCDVSMVTFNHTSLKLWRAMMTINLISNEMGQKDVHQKTQELNAFYNKNVLFNDFDEGGYRTFIVASKKKDLSYKANTSTDQQTALDLLGRINDFYQTTLVEAEYIPKLRKRVKDLHDQTIRLAEQVDHERNEALSERRQKEAITNTKAWRAYAKISRSGKSN